MSVRECFVDTITAANIFRSNLEADILAAPAHELLHLTHTFRATDAASVLQIKLLFNSAYRGVSNVQPCV